MGWVGKVWKKLSRRRKEGREGGGKKLGACRARGSNPGPAVSRVLGEGPQLHATGVVQTS